MIEVDTDTEILTLILMLIEVETEIDVVVSVVVIVSVIVVVPNIGQVVPPPAPVVVVDAGHVAIVIVFVCSVGPQLVGYGGCGLCGLSIVTVTVVVKGAHVVVKGGADHLDVLCQLR